VLAYCEKAWTMSRIKAEQVDVRSLVQSLRVFLTEVRQAVSCAR
jgi:hypothetical protein